MTASDRAATRNGVDLAAVQAIVERYRDDPDAGRHPFATRVRWLGHRFPAWMSKQFLHGDQVCPV